MRMKTGSILFHRLTLTLTLSLAFLSTASAQELWRGTTHGMTEAQVKERIPGTVKPVKPETLFGGATERLRLEGVDVAGVPVDAKFYFKGEHLWQVTLVPKEQHRFDQSLKTF